MRLRLKDAFGRRIDYLRISLTEKCNFRCVYCMPPEGISRVCPRDVLETDEIVRLVRILAACGVTRVRLTGGEPLLRRDIVTVVEKLSGIPGISHVALTTNGSRLSRTADSLKHAGLNGVNISIDSLRRGRFREVTGRDGLVEVLEGLKRSVDAGLGVKVNVVALRGLGEDEVLEFCALARRNAIEVRFIEFMPLCGSGWRRDLFLPMFQVKSWIRKRYPLVPMERGTAVAETFGIQGSSGRIGFIASLSEPFCEACNRLRLTSSGELRLCLFSPENVNVRALLRGAASDEEILRSIRRAVWFKPKGTDLWKEETDPGRRPKIRMIGG